MNRIQNAAPQFGWSHDNPPIDYRIRIGRNDFSDLENLEPSDEFVATVAEKLVGEEDTDPRFAFIENAQKFLRSQKRLRAFQHTLMQRVGEYLAVHHPKTVAVHEEFTRRRYRPENVEQTLETSRFDTMNRKGKPPETQLSWYTHWDYYQWPLISFTYGPVKNLDNPGTLIFDGRQYARDKNKSLVDMLLKRLMKTQHWTYLYKRFYKWKALYPYMMQFPNDGLLIVNNTIDAGIGHGPSNARRVNKKEPVTRFIHRVALRTSRKAD